MFSTGTSLPVSLYVYDMKVESAVRINTRARLYVKLPLRADAKIVEAANVIKIAFH